MGLDWRSRDGVLGIGIVNDCAESSTPDAGAIALNYIEVFHQIKEYLYEYEW
ncbi:hypothetical protein NUACC21_38650 [Scytonema sp. NUACC21]